MKIQNTIALCIIYIVTFIVVLPLSGENVTLQQCEEHALINHPLAQQKQWIDLTRDSDINIANTHYLPKLSFLMYATRQSEATSISSPLITFQGNLTQWRLGGEINQLVFDGGTTEAIKNNVIAEAEITKNQINVNLESIRELILETYFSIILIDSQVEQEEIIENELSAIRKKLITYMDNGIATQSDIDTVKVEELKSKAKMIELETNRDIAIYRLSQLTGMSIDSETHFVRPKIQKQATENILNYRKEFEVFRSKLDALDAKQRFLATGLYPKVQVFAQAGYSEPGLNMLATNPSFWWIVGIKGSFSLDSYYTFGADTNKITTAKNQIETQIEQFRLEENIKLNQKLSEIAKLEHIIEIDNEIISLKKSIKEVNDARLTTGTLSISDLIEEFNEVKLAISTKTQHEVQLLLAQSELSLIEGNGEYQE